MALAYAEAQRFLYQPTLPSSDVISYFNPQAHAEFTNLLSNPVGIQHDTLEDSWDGLLYSTGNKVINHKGEEVDEQVLKTVAMGLGELLKRGDLVGFSKEAVVRQLFLAPQQEKHAVQVIGDVYEIYGHFDISTVNAIARIEKSGDFSVRDIHDLIGGIEQYEKALIDRFGLPISTAEWSLNEMLRFARRATIASSTYDALKNPNSASVRNPILMQLEAEVDQLQNGLKSPGKMEYDDAIKAMSTLSPWAKSKPGGVTNLHNPYLVGNRVQIYNGLRRTTEIFPILDHTVLQRAA